MQTQNDLLADADSFLQGRIRRRTLAALTPPLGPDAPLLKRLLLSQGELAQVYDADGPIRYLAFLELKAGTRRGDHYHRHKQEWLYLARGELVLEAADVERVGREEILVRAGDLVCIEPGVAHALRTRADGFAVEFSPARFDPADSYRFSVG